MSIIKTFGLLTLMLLAVAANANGSHPGQAKYEITVTNLTRGQTFTPILVTTHSGAVSLFQLGSPASTELSVLAEGGDTQPLMDALLDFPDAVGAAQTSPGLLAPGQSITISIYSPRRMRHLSLAAMLIPTNDSFVALNAVELPRRGAVTFFARAYDAGSEPNDQSCAHMPGPRCGGEGTSPDPDPADEGYVYVGNGFHELGTVDSNGDEVLQPATYSWINPVAEITIAKVR